MKLPEDPYVLELLPEFVDTWIQDIEAQLDNFIETQNADELYRMAHTLKGSCFQFGLDEIAEKGIKLMGLAKNKDWENASNLGHEIQRDFYSVREFLNNLNK